jgi:hypothetical protein
LNGVQVVAGSNPVAPTTVFIDKPPSCFDGAWAVFLLIMTSAGLLSDSSSQGRLAAAIHAMSSVIDLAIGAVIVMG